MLEQFVEATVVGQLRGKVNVERVMNAGNEYARFVLTVLNPNSKKGRLSVTYIEATVWDNALVNVLKNRNYKNGAFLCVTGRLTTELYCNKVYIKLFARDVYDMTPNNDEEITMIDTKSNEEEITKDTTTGVTEEDYNF